jgi:hypothetical protein
MKTSFLETVAAGVVAYLVIAYWAGTDPAFRAWYKKQWSA